MNRKNKPLTVPKTHRGGPTTRAHRETGTETLTRPLNHDVEREVGNPRNEIRDRQSQHRGHDLPRSQDSPIPIPAESQITPSLHRAPTRTGHVQRHRSSPGVPDVHRRAHRVPRLRRPPIHGAHNLSTPSIPEDLHVDRLHRPRAAQSHRNSEKTRDGETANQSQTNRQQKDATTRPRHHPPSHRSGLPG